MSEIAEKAPRVKAGDKKYTGIEPVWDTSRAENFSKSEFNQHFIRSLNYYNYNYMTKDLRKFLDRWLQEQLTQKMPYISKEDVRLYLKTPDSLTPITACSVIKAHYKGMPLLSEHIEYVVKIVKNAIAKNNSTESVASNEDAKPKTAKVVSIQDRLQDILNEHIGHFDEIEDQVIRGTKVEVNSYDYLAAQQVPQNLLGKMQDVFEQRLAEIQQARKTDDEQLKEGYAHLKSADFKRFDEFYTKIIEGIEQYKQVKKATKKARVRKAPAKEKLVAKLKYLKTDNDLKLVSVNPTSIIGAQHLWVYDTKTRKLYVYEADGGGLGVKGTSITDYNAVSSVGKTLRKPAEQLAEFLKANKRQQKSFLKGIKAVEIKASGRINANQVLLKVS